MGFKKHTRGVKRISFWLGLWFLFVIYYAASLKYGLYAKEADYVAYFVQMVADVFMGTFSTLVLLKTKDRGAKIFYFLIFVSVLPGLISTEMYNVLINIINIKNINSSINQLWTLPYSFFLIIQISAWSYLLYMSGKRQEKINWLSRFSYAQPIVMILMPVLLTSIFRNIFFKNISVVGIANTIMEVVGFTLMSVCLSRSRNKALTYVAAGFLFLMAFNLAHRFSYLTGHYYKSFDMIWLVCYIIIIFGFSLALKSRYEKFAFFKLNSIHVLINTIFTIFAALFFTIFLFFGFVISSIEVNGIGFLSIFPESIPSILVFLFTFSIILSKVIAVQFSKPLDIITRRIDLAYGGDLEESKIKNEQFAIYEVDKFDKFIMKILSKLQSANRVKAEFLMNMSHDFRTPTSGIYSMSKAIYKRTGDPELKRLQKLVVDSSGELMNILEDVLTYSYLDHNKQNVVFKTFDVVLVLEDIISLLSVKAEVEQLTLRREFPKEGLYCKSDQQIIHRVILNIVSNAIKFTHKGSVTICARKEIIDQKEWIVIKVKDTGIGIDETKHKLIFEPFSRVQSSETSKYPGIGLGLSNVRLMLEKIGGKIALESKLNQGAVFSIFLSVENL